MSKNKSQNQTTFIYNFIFFLGLNVIVNFICNYVSAHNLLPENPVLRFTFVHNTGAAFSILESQIPFLIAVGVIAIIYILYKVYFSKKSLNKTSAVGFAILAAGVTHNLYERIHFGFVIDYFDLRFIHFPVFNMADTLITIGAIIIISQILVKKL